MNDEMNQEREQHSLVDELDELRIRLAEKVKEKEEIEVELKQHQAEFEVSDHFIHSLKNLKQSLKSNLRAIPAYLLGRRNLKRLYSKAYKQKAAENELKVYKKYLYDSGFEERALRDLLQLFSTTENRYLKRALAWELGLYYANQLDERTADLAIGFLSTALSGRERDLEFKRKVAILQAESYDLLGNQNEARTLLMQLLHEIHHADIYLALANLEETPEKRLEWINQSLHYYGLQEMELSSDPTGKVDAYYRLHAIPNNVVHVGPKVSVIIPAYNAEAGIRVALESLLKQTWGNLELLVVDDCSTDGTQQVVKEYMQKDKRIKLLSTPQNSGPYIARNIGLKHATGEFVTINDADDWSHPEKIQKQTEHILANPKVIANTSGHARLTENLKPYRRSMPGNYIFSNMSSLLFRREAVLEKIGYWDHVRFAADSEFKNRMIRVFGLDAIVDLDTGPLSFPMQSSNSLTASSTYGYTGFLMGVRKEYRESYGYYHDHAQTLYMPYATEKRLFPVPEPMQPERTKKGQARNIDVVVIADYREKITTDLHKQLEAMKEMGLKVGLVQMGKYDLKQTHSIHPSVREIIDGNHIQMLVYGERITCQLLFIHNPAIFAEKQKYVPEVEAKIVRVIITEVPGRIIGNKKVQYYQLRECARRIDEFIKVRSKWYPIHESLREELQEHHDRELRSISLSVINWQEVTKDSTTIKNVLENWFVEENPFRLE